MKDLNTQFMEMVGHQVVGKYYGASFGGEVVSSRQHSINHCEEITIRLNNTIDLWNGQIHHDAGSCIIVSTDDVEKSRYQRFEHSVQVTA